MKTKIKILILFFALSCVCSCKAQLMQTLKDAHKIKENRVYYADKPFKVLLKDIKPTIIAYSVSLDPNLRMANLYLYFTSVSEHRQRLDEAAENHTPPPASITVRFDPQDISLLKNILNKQSGAWSKGIADSLNSFIVKGVYSIGNN